MSDNSLSESIRKGIRAILTLKVIRCSVAYCAGRSVIPVMGVLAVLVVLLGMVLCEFVNAERSELLFVN